MDLKKDIALAPTERKKNNLITACKQQADVRISYECRTPISVDEID